MAKVKILVEGFTNADSAEAGGDEKTSPTITLIQDSGLNIVVDPGVLESQQVLIDKLKEEGLKIEDIDFVFLTHSHIDHYRNVGMFPNAKTLEYFGIWDGQKCLEWQEQFTSDIRVIKTAGHSNDSLSFLVNTHEGVVAIVGDVFWKENSPETDPYASNPGKLEESRKKVLELADYIVPGHGSLYKVEN